MKIPYPIMGSRGKKRVSFFFTVGLILMFLSSCRITTPIVTPEEGAARESQRNVNKNQKNADEAKTVSTNVGVPSDGNKGKVDESSNRYKIGPGDVLHVSVWNNEELTMDVMVRPDGKISLPLLQDVSASGFTAEELRDILAKRLKKYIIEPIVTVTVKEVNYPKFFMMGEISKPGTYPLRERLTILQAISLAGGFTEFASTSNIILIRNSNPEQKRIRINYNSLLKSGAEDKNIYLKPGDTIIIP